MLNKITPTILIPNDSSKTTTRIQLPTAEVDRVADELVTEYGNPAFRQWYCRAIYDLGFEQIQILKQRAKEGRDPAKLFSFLVKQARTSRAPWRPS